jgi:acetoin utilization protein AcuB
MQVRDWMTTSVEVVRPDDDVESARALMRARRVRQLPVVSGGTIVGIITDRDLRGAAHDAAAKVSSLMTPGPLTTTPGTLIEDAASVLRMHKIGALPVVEHGRMVGIVSESDLLDALVELTRIAEPTTLLQIECDDGIREMERARRMLERRGANVLWMRSACETDGRVHVTLRVRSPLGFAPEQALEESGFRVSLCVTGTRRATQPTLDGFAARQA